jgi:outer membrane protein OmpA-like peptidoglycan-associated protein
LLVAGENDAPKPCTTQGNEAASMLKQVAVVGMLLIASHGVAAAQQPTPEGPFLVFFDWGKPDLRNDDAATLDQVATALRAHPGARLQMAGYADRSGSVATNHSAGLWRAQMLRGELEKRGVPRNAMSVASFGEE